MIQKPAELIEKRFVQARASCETFWRENPCSLSAMSCQCHFRPNKSKLEKTVKPFGGCHAKNTGSNQQSPNIKTYKTCQMADKLVARLKPEAKAATRQPEAAEPKLQRSYGFLTPALNLFPVFTVLWSLHSVVSELVHFSGCDQRTCTFHRTRGGSRPSQLCAHTSDDTCSPFTVNISHERLRLESAWQRKR